MIITGQIGIIMFTGFQRQYLFCDEVFSYGLANSEEFAFLHPGENDTLVNRWVSGSYFSDYMEFDVDVPFSFRAAFENQVQDVHPPLYYCLLHVVCGFFHNGAYTTISGILLNIIIAVMADLALLYVASFFLKSREKAILTLLLWGLSSSCLSNIMLIRMYCLQTLEILLLVAFHVYILKHKRKMTVPYFVAIALLVTMGGLTHYYFYFFMAALGVLVCLYLLCSKKKMQMLAYGMSLVAGFTLAIAVFPSTIIHVFGYRGSYAIEGLKSLSVEKLNAYFHIANKSLMANSFRVVGVIFIFIMLYKVINIFFCHIHMKLLNDSGKHILEMNFERVKTEKICVRVNMEEADILCGFSIAASLALGYVAIQGSEIINARYIYPVYPFLAVVLVAILDWIVCSLVHKYKIFLLALCCAAFAFGSIKINGIDWLYDDYRCHKEEAERLEGSDCVIICHDNSWNNIYEGMNLYVNMNQCCYLLDSQLDMINELIANRTNKEQLIVSFPGDPGFTQEQRDEILKMIVDASDYSTFELAYDYYTKVYVLK